MPWKHHGSCPEPRDLSVTSLVTSHCLTLTPAKNLLSTFQAGATRNGRLSTHTTPKVAHIIQQENVENPHTDIYISIAPRPTISIVYNANTLVAQPANINNYAMSRSKARTRPHFVLAVIPPCSSATRTNCAQSLSTQLEAQHHTCKG